MQRAGAIVIILIIAVAAGAYLYFKKAPFSTAFPEGVLFGTTTMGVVEAPDHSELYRNDHYRFSLYYPEMLVLEEYDEGGDARTLVFSDPETGYGFQIFIIPYAEDSVTSERFRQDSPSGVFKEPLNVLIDGAPATAFFSSNSIMGDTREVWIINGGYLYEVTTFKEFDDWFVPIMETWRFH